MEFDPQAFAQKLAFTPEVSALDISEEDATRLGIGFHPQRRAVYFPQKDETGFIAGFIAFKDGKLVMPPEMAAADQRGEIETCMRGLRASFLLALLQRDGSRQAARMRVLTRRQSSSIACRSRWWFYVVR
jgi:hypothetical protein